MSKIATLFAIAALALAVPGAAAEKDVELIPSCQYCGMDRGKFASTRMHVLYEGGTVIGTCSIHCAAVDLAQSITKPIKSIQVADAASGKLVDAEKATWVIGADQPGVMSRRSRLAFSERSAAEALVKEKGGEIGDWEAAINSTYADMWSDTQMIRAKRAKGGGMPMHR